MSLAQYVPLTEALVAPHSEQAEKEVLGSVLINPNVFEVISEFLKADDFFILNNGWVWEAMERLTERGDPIDNTTVINELRTQGRLDDIGGMAYIVGLSSYASSARNAEAYGRIVERTAIRRGLLEAANAITRIARDEETTIEEATGDAEKALGAVLERNGSNDNTKSMLEASSAFYDAVEYRYLHPDEPIGITSGFTDLDSLLRGFQKSDLVILGGRPAMGKTSLMLNLVINGAKAGYQGAFFNLEMNNEQLMLRVYATETGINSQKLLSGRLTAEEFKLFVKAKTEIDKLPVTWDDTPSISLPKLRSTCLRLKRQKKLDYVFVDYIQMMNPVRGKSAKEENRVQEISYLARGLKGLARELNVPVIVGSQLSRNVENRTDKRPLLSDLKESGTIEESADVVMFLYRDDVYNTASERPNEAEIIVSKHRNGPTGTACLYFRKHLTQFANLTRTKVNVGDI